MSRDVIGKSSLAQPQIPGLGKPHLPLRNLMPVAQSGLVETQDWLTNLHTPVRLDENPLDDAVKRRSYTLRPISNNLDRSKHRHRNRTCASSDNARSNEHRSPPAPPPPRSQGTRAMERLPGIGECLGFARNELAFSTLPRPLPGDEQAGKCLTGRKQQRLPDEMSEWIASSLRRFRLGERRKIEHDRLTSAVLRNECGHHPVQPAHEWRILLTEHEA